jgi:hypothetical protein
MLSHNLTPKQARKIFHVRTGTLDLRCVRKYKYGDSTLCRLCQNGEETIEHVLNDCVHIERTTKINNHLTTNPEELPEVANRCLAFDKKIEELDKEKEV